MSKNVAKAKLWLEAARRGELAKISELLAGRGNPDLSGPDGRTALMNAAGGGHLDVVQALLAAGADPAVRSNAGHTALAYALRPDWAGLFLPGPRSDRVAVILLLLRAGGRLDFENLAAAIGWLDLEELLVLVDKTPTARSTWTAAAALCRRNAFDAAHSGDILEDILTSLAAYLSRQNRR